MTFFFLLLGNQTKKEKKLKLSTAKKEKSSKITFSFPFLSFSLQQETHQIKKSFFFLSFLSNQTKRERERDTDRENESPGECYASLTQRQDWELNRLLADRGLGRVQESSQGVTNRKGEVFGKHGFDPSVFRESRKRHHFRKRHRRGSKRRRCVRRVQ